MSLSNHKLLKQLFALIIYDLMGSLASQTNEPKIKIQRIHDEREEKPSKGRDIEKKNNWYKENM